MKKIRDIIDEHRIISFVIMMLLFFGFIMLINRGPKEELKFEPKVEPKVVPKVEPKTIEQTIISKLGDKTNMGVKRIKSIEDLAGDGSLISIHFVVDENWGPTWTRDGAIDDAMEVMKNLYQNYPKIERITMFAYFPVIDKYGNEDYKLGLKMMLDKATANKINWRNMYPSDFKNVLDDYRELLNFGN